MGEVGGLELIDESLEDKFEYKKMLFPGKQKNLKENLTSWTYKNIFKSLQTFM